MKKKSQRQSTKKARAVTNYTPDEVKRYLGSLSEDFQHKVSAIGEQFGSINGKIEQLAEELIPRTSNIERDVTIIKTNVEIVKGDLKKKVDYDEFQILTRRVAALEHRTRR